MKISVSLAQLQLHFGDVTKNMHKMIDIVENQMPNSILLLPELWSSSYDLKNTPLITQANLKVLQVMAQVAKRKQIYIGGSLLEDIDGEIFNTFTLFSPNGEQIAKYNKTHLFRLMEEHRWMKPGNQLITIETNWGKAGLAICYDLRFPEMFRRYALMGCQVIFLVAEWPLRRVEHWRTLLQARAIENQYFVAAVNCAGEIGNAVYGGSSMIIDPWGKILCEAPQTNEKVISAELDLDLVEKVRSKIPVFQDRRSDIYGD